MHDDALGLSALTPLAHLDRAADFLPTRTAYRFEDVGTTYEAFRDQVRAAAGRLVATGVTPGDRVALLARNTPLSLLAHFAVPWSGAALVALNHRLAAHELAGILRHAEPRVLLVDDALAGLAAASLTEDGLNDVIVQRAADLVNGEPLMSPRVDDERDLIALNYTSGTTGAPKGAMYRHRGAFLQALSMAYHLRLEPGSVYLWTLPMFHCNGWSFPWAVAAAGATSLCTDSTDPRVLWRLIRDEGVTHFCAAPTLLISLLSSPEATRPAQPVTVATGGAPPTPTLIRRAEQLGLRVVHLYGLTETYGPSLICTWQPEWDDLSAEEQADRAARQGIPTIAAPRVRLTVPDRDDNRTADRGLEELTMAGNTVMAGYFRDPDATAAASIGDTTFRTGDLAVQHDDRYLQLQDRAKDIIISGGENISSVEVERVLAEHPAVQESAVIGRPDPKWGEVPVAFVTLLPGAEPVTAEELTEFLRGRLARFKAPKEIHFGDLPKTATGKIRKVELRTR